MHTSFQPEAIRPGTIVHGVRFDAHDRVTITQFARQLGISAATAHRWALAGVRGVTPLRKMLLGGKSFITADEWRRFHEAVNATAGHAA